MAELNVRDAALTSHIRSRLVHDKRVGDQPVSVYITDSDVYLVGRVETLEQRDIVEYIIRGTPGVQHVNTDEVEIGEIIRMTK